MRSNTDDDIVMETYLNFVTASNSTMSNIVQAITNINYSFATILPHNSNTYTNQNNIIEPTRSNHSDLNYSYPSYPNASYQDASYPNASYQDTPYIYPSTNQYTNYSYPSQSIESIINPNLYNNPQSTITPSITPSINPSITPSIQSSIDPSITPPSIDPSIVPSIDPSIPPSIPSSIPLRIPPSITIPFNNENSIRETLDELFSQSEIGYQIHNVGAIIFNRFANLPPPVVIRPRLAQINYGTEIFAFRDIEEPLNTSCPICQEDFEPDDEVMQIKMCRHNFRRECLVNWFQGNVHCPLCRYDIRDYFLNNDLEDRDDDDDESSEEDFDIDIDDYDYDDDYNYDYNNEEQEEQDAEREREREIEERIERERSDEERSEQERSERERSDEERSDQERRDEAIRLQERVREETQESQRLEEENNQELSEIIVPNHLISYYNRENFVNSITEQVRTTLNARMNDIQTNVPFELRIVRIHY